MTMQMPGYPAPGQQPSTLTVLPAQAKRVGLMRMTAGSKHLIAIFDAAGAPVIDNQGRQVKVLMTAKDRRSYPRATGTIFCMHPSCVGKQWKTEAEVIAAVTHSDPIAMQKRGEVHLLGFCSNDPINAPQDGCKACEAKTKDAKRPHACPDHSGGVLGLLTPGDPAVIG